MTYQQFIEKYRKHQDIIDSHCTPESFQALTKRLNQVLEDKSFVEHFLFHHLVDISPEQFEVEEKILSSLEQSNKSLPSHFFEALTDAFDSFSLSTNATKEEKALFMSQISNIDLDEFEKNKTFYKTFLDGLIDELFSRNITPRNNLIDFYGLALKLQAFSALPNGEQSQAKTGNDMLKTIIEKQLINAKTLHNFRAVTQQSFNSDVLSFVSKKNHSGEFENFETILEIFEQDPTIILELNNLVQAQDYIEQNGGLKKSIELIQKKTTEKVYGFKNFQQVHEFLKHFENINVEFSRQHISSILESKQYSQNIDTTAFAEAFPKIEPFFQSLPDSFQQDFLKIAFRFGCFNNKVQKTTLQNSNGIFDAEATQTSIITDNSTENSTALFTELIKRDVINMSSIPQLAARGLISDDFKEFLNQQDEQGNFVNLDIVYKILPEPEIILSPEIPLAASTAFAQLCQKHGTEEVLKTVTAAFNFPNNSPLSFLKSYSQALDYALAEEMEKNDIQLPYALLGHSDNKQRQYLIQNISNDPDSFKSNLSKILSLYDQSPFVSHKNIDKFNSSHLTGFLTIAYHFGCLSTQKTQDGKTLGEKGIAILERLIEDKAFKRGDLNCFKFDTTPNDDYEKYLDFLLSDNGKGALNAHTILELSRNHVLLKENLKRNLDNAIAISNTHNGLGNVVDKLAKGFFGNAEMFSLTEPEMQAAIKLSSTLAKNNFQLSFNNAVYLHKDQMLEEFASTAYFKIFKKELDKTRYKTISERRFRDLDENAPERINAKEITRTITRNGQKVQIKEYKIKLPTLFEELQTQSKQTQNALFGFAKLLGCFSNEKILDKNQNPTKEVLSIKASSFLCNLINDDVLSFQDISDNFASYLNLSTPTNQDLFKFLSVQSKDKTYDNIEMLKTLQASHNNILTNVFQNFDLIKSLRVGLAPDGTPQNRSWQEAIEEFLTIGNGKINLDYVSEQDMDIAQLFNYHGLSEQTFYHATQLRQTAIDENIPKHILQAEIKAPSAAEQIKKIREETGKDIAQCKKLLQEIKPQAYTYEMLDKSDPRNFILGMYCSCCATIDSGFYGKELSERGVIARDVQNLIVRDNQGNIIAKGTLYLNEKDRYAVINDFEINEKFKIGQKDGEIGHYHTNKPSEINADKQRRQIFDAFVRGAEAFAQEFDKTHEGKELLRINVGNGYNRLNYLCEKLPQQKRILHVPKDYCFNDAMDRQFILYDRQAYLEHQKAQERSSQENQAEKEITQGNQEKTLEATESTQKIETLAKPVKQNQNKPEEAIRQEINQRGMEL